MTTIDGMPGVETTPDTFTEPEPEDEHAGFPRAAFILTQIEGRTGKWVGIMQALCGYPSAYTHAAIVLGGGTCMEFQPGGAIVGKIDKYLDGRRLLVCDGPVRMALANLGDNTEGIDEEKLRSKVVAAATALQGTPYGWLDYLALGLMHLGLPSKWLRRYVDSQRSLICSAGVDRSYRNAGVHLYWDGRYSGDVMPADLDTWAHEYDVHVLRGGPAPGGRLAKLKRGGRIATKRSTLR